MIGGPNDAPYSYTHSYTLISFNKESLDSEGQACKRKNACFDANGWDEADWLGAKLKLLAEEPSHTGGNA